MALEQFQRSVIGAPIVHRGAAEIAAEGPMKSALEVSPRTFINVTNISASGRWPSLSLQAEYIISSKRCKRSCLDLTGLLNQGLGPPSRLRDRSDLLL